MQKFMEKYVTKVSILTTGAILTAQDTLAASGIPFEKALQPIKESIQDSLIPYLLWAAFFALLASIAMGNRGEGTIRALGVVIIGMTIDGKTREIVANTDVQTRGFIYLKDSENVVKGIMNIAETELESYKNKTEEDIRDVRQNIKDKVNKYIIKETGKRPVILPVIIEL